MGLERHAISSEQRQRERDDVAIVLLLLQSVFGLLSLLGLVVVAAIFPVVTPAGFMVLLGFVLPLIVARGIARGRRWARRWAVVFQTVTLLGVFVNLLLGYIPQTQMELTLAGLFTGVLLPVTLIGLVRVPSPARRTITASAATGAVVHSGSVAAARQAVQGV